MKIIRRKNVSFWGSTGYLLVRWHLALTGITLLAVLIAFTLPRLGGWKSLDKLNPIPNNTSAHRQVNHESKQDHGPNFDGEI